MARSLALATLARLLPLVLVPVPQFAGAAGIGVRVIAAGEVRPGVYGRIEIGNLPPPPLVYPQPVLVVPAHRPVAVAPLYLHVPPGHAKHWSRHCHRYGACAQPVYFVKSAEYGRRHGTRHGEGHRGRRND